MHACWAAVYIAPRTQERGEVGGAGGSQAIKEERDRGGRDVS